MMADTLAWGCDDAERISRALAVDGAHLFIGQGGYTLFHQRGTTLSGYDVVPMKAACIVAGLPVIDSHMLPFDTALQLAIHSPMIAVGEPPDAHPWHGWAHAPLHHVAALYHAAGAEVVNLPEVTGTDGETTP